MLGGVAMLLFDGALGLVFLALWIFCIIDVITTPEDKCRNLPKLAWVVIVLLLVDIGSVAWLVAGRAWNREPRPLAGTPARPAKRAVATNPDDDEEFLSSLRARAEEQRRRAREEPAADDPQNPPEQG